MCGGGYTIIGKDRYGCAAHRSKGTCGNDRTITRHEIEERVLAGLKERLLAPDMVAAFAAEFQAEMARQQTEAARSSATTERELAQVERKIAGLLKAIEDGLYNASMKERMAALEQTRNALLVERSRASSPARPVALHPNLPEVYRRKVEQLEAVLEGEERMEALALIRSMIDAVVLTPRGQGTGLDALLYGDLAAILAVCAEAGPKHEHPGSGVPGCHTGGAGSLPSSAAGKTRQINAIALIERVIRTTPSGAVRIKCRWLRGRATAFVCSCPPCGFL